MRYLFYTYLALFGLKALAAGEWDGIASVEKAVQQAAQVGKTIGGSSATTSSQLGRGTTSGSTTSGTDSLDSLYASIDAGYEKTLQQVNSGTSASATAASLGALAGDVFSLNSDCWVKSCRNRPDYVQCIGQGPDIIAKASAQSPQRPLLCAEFAAEQDILAALGKDSSNSSSLMQLLPMLMGDGESNPVPDFVGLVPQQD